MRLLGAVRYIYNNKNSISYVYYIYIIGIGLKNCKYNKYYLFYGFIKCIKISNAVKLLKRKGYCFHFCPSIYGPTRSDRALHSILFY